jgi:hypothetical protein
MNLRNLIDSTSSSVHLSTEAQRRAEADAEAQAKRQAEQLRQGMLQELATQERRLQLAREARAVLGDAPPADATALQELDWRARVGETEQQVRTLELRVAHIKDVNKQRGIR